MVENPYFSASVRIQQDRGQVVISTGPYKFVRHPGYSSAVVSNLVFPIVLGTLWTLIPAVLTIGLIILRTALEDQMLQEDLPGYKEYASQVRFRLIPGFW
jgi:protein-S-isoprenylcysteine O-methyltransferase Ste14